MRQVKTRLEIAQMMDDMTNDALKKYGQQAKQLPMRERALDNAKGKKWRHRWMPSSQYVLMTVALDKVEQPKKPKSGAVVMKKVEHFDPRPVFIDKNIAKRTTWGPHKTGGQKLATVVIDGKHRTESAHILGKKTIRAWVGTLAVNHFLDPNSEGYWWLKALTDGKRVQV